MRRRIGPLLSLVLLVVLAVVVYFTEFRGAGARLQAEADRSRPIPFTRADLEEIVVRNERGEEVTLAKGDSDAWRVTAPLAAEADKDAVEGMLIALETARIDRRLGAEADLKPYGLDPPRSSIALRLKGKEAPRVLAIGDENPIGGSLFALLPDGKEVAVVTASVADIAKKDLLALRDKSLLALDPWKVKRLRLERPGGAVLLERPDDGWSVRQPVETPADGPTVTDILTGLEALRARAFAAENPTERDLKRFGLDPPVARVGVLQEGWDVERTVLFGRKEGDLRYARTAGKDPVVTVPDEFWAKLATGLGDLRRRDLLGVSQYRVEKITAARAGGEALVLSRQKEGGWSASGGVSGTVKGDAIDALLRMISDLKAAGWNDRPGEAERVALSRRPALDLTLTEEAGADGAAAKSQHLVIGPPRGGVVAVRDMAWRPIARVPAASYEAIVRQIDAVTQEAAAPPPAATPGPSPHASPPAER